MSTIDLVQIDSLLGPGHYSYTLQRLTDPGIHWFYLPYTAGAMDLDNLPAYQGTFSHTVHNHENGPISPLWESCWHILLTALDHRNQVLDELYRIRYGFATRTPMPIRHSPHIDQGVEHRVGLFYPETTSGPTVIYNERSAYDGQVPEEFTDAVEIEPQANRWIDFDGSHFHSSTTPDRHETRRVLTFNYSIRK